MVLLFLVDCCDDDVFSDGDIGGGGGGGEGEGEN